MFGGKDLKTATALIKARYFQELFYDDVMKYVFEFLEGMEEAEVAKGGDLTALFGSTSTRCSKAKIQRSCVKTSPCCSSNQNSGKEF